MFTDVSPPATVGNRRSPPRGSLVGTRITEAEAEELNNRLSDIKDDLFERHSMALLRPMWPNAFDNGGLEADMSDCDRV